MEKYQETEEQDAGGGLQVETIKSYVAFARRALALHRWTAVIVVVVGLALTVVVYQYLPRTYYCQTTILGQSNQVLEGWQVTSPFAGVNSLILRHENLEAIVRDTKLVEKFKKRRPPALKFKDDLMAKAFGPLNDDAIRAGLLGRLESSITVMTDGSTLTVGVAWSDGATAAEVAEAARESFIKARQTSEMSAFQEKIAILEGHAKKLGEEAEKLAAQIRNEKQARLAEAQKAAKASASSASSSAPAPRVVVRRPEASIIAADPAMKEKLEGLKRRLADLDGERDRKLREQQAKLADLKLRFAPSHPEVMTAQQRVEILLQEPSEVALLRSEIRSLEGEIGQREALSKVEGASRRFGGGGSAAPASAALPTDITELLGDDDTDPALVAQLSGAVVKYGAVRSDIRSAGIDLDTAQAAFSHRYKLIVPADPPNQPIKPKALTVLGGGLAAALLIALLIPLLRELSTGVMVERWQVQALRLPVLGELKLPPHSAD